MRGPFWPWGSAAQGASEGQGVLPPLVGAGVKGPQTTPILAMATAAVPASAETAAKGMTAPTEPAPDRTATE